MKETKLTEIEKTRLKRATLEWCNEQRKRKGIPPIDELPQGFVGDPESCPCGKATGMDVGITDAVDYGVPIFKVSLPRDVMDFVNRFDNEEIPELIDNALPDGDSELVSYF